MSTQAAAATPPTDWEAIERKYRAGVLSVREIAKQHGITHGAINKRAKKEGWTRDLTKKVREAVSTALVSTPVSTAEQADTKRTEREIVEDAAATIVALVREHRGDLRELRELAASLTSQLRMAAGNRDAILAVIEEVVDEMPAGNVGERAKRDAARKAMTAAVSLPAHISSLKDLSNVLKNLIPLERQAFNVDDGPPPDAGDDDAPPPSQAALDAFEQRLLELTKARDAAAPPAAAA